MSSKNSDHALDMREVPGALEAPVIIEGSVQPILPFGLKPAKPRVPKHQIIDLGLYDPEWEGTQIVIDKDLPIEIEEVGMRATDESLSPRERIEANYRFLELALLAWNATVPNPFTGEAILLKQPRDGGVRQLTTSQVKAIIAAFNAAYGAAPK